MKYRQGFVSERPSGNGQRRVTVIARWLYVVVLCLASCESFKETSKGPLGRQLHRPSVVDRHDRCDCRPPTLDHRLRRMFTDVSRFLVAPPFSSQFRLTFIRCSLSSRSSQLSICFRLFRPDRLFQDQR